MPTRRVALGDWYLPIGGPGYGAVLLGAVVADNVDGLDEEQRDLLPRLLYDARRGLDIPRIALRYRLQTDVHGLDLSRHRLEHIQESGRVVLELDVHAHPAPQLLGAVLAAAAMAPTTRKLALRAIEQAVAHPGELPEGVDVRRLLHGVPGMRPTAPGETPWIRDKVDAWRGVPSERRWAMEVLGLDAERDVERRDVQQRFRRLVRLAHPDHGATGAGAAERIAELSEAREILLGSSIAWA